MPISNVKEDQLFAGTATVVVGTALVIGGVVAILIGGRLAESSIESTFGSVDPETVAASEGTGVVPSWISLLVLVGYVTVLAGVVALIVGFAI